MQRTFSIRQYQPADHDRVVELFVQGMREYVDIMPAPRRESFTPLLDKYIEDSIADDLANVDKVYFNRTEGPKGNFWVITEQTDGGEVVQGMVGLEYKSDQDAELRRMSISKDARRQGLAKRLLDHLVAHAREQGFEKVVLTTGQHMPQANTMYSVYGFKKVKEDPIVVWYEYVIPKLSQIGRAHV